jgi:hypothetical protein
MSANYKGEIVEFKRKVDLLQIVFFSGAARALVAQPLAVSDFAAPVRIFVGVASPER